MAELVGTRCLGVYGRYLGAVVEEALVAVGEPIGGAAEDGEVTRRGCAVRDSCDEVLFIAENWLPAGDGGCNASLEAMSDVDCGFGEHELQSRGYTFRQLEAQAFGHFRIDESWKERDGRRGGDRRRRRRKLYE